MKIAVIGGGIGGLCTALALENNGFSPVLLESAPSFSPVGAGLSLSPNALQGLQVLGVKDAYLKVARNYSTAFIKKQDGTIISKMELDRITAFTGGVFSTVHRHDLHALLLGALQRTELLNGKQLIAFEQRPSSVLLTFQDGTAIEADVVIAADGLHSLIRKQLLPAAQERFSGQVCWRGVCANEFSIRDMSESWGNGLRFGIVPLHNDRIYWFAVKDAELEGTAQAMDKEKLMQLFSEFHEPVTKLIQSTPVANIYGNDLNDLAPIRQFAFGNILLLGDAAHATTPNLGQGACMAIEDAALLQRLLQTQKDFPQVFREFEERRIKRTTRIVNTSARLGKLAQSRSPFIVAVRNGLLKYMPFAANKPFYRFLFGYTTNAD